MAHLFFDGFALAVFVFIFLDIKSHERVSSAWEVDGDTWPRHAHCLIRTSISRDVIEN